MPRGEIPQGFDGRNKGSLAHRIARRVQEGMGAKAAYVIVTALKAHPDAERAEMVKGIRELHAESARQA